MHLKADVYSFGVLILDVINGKSSSKTNRGGSLKFFLEWDWQLHEEGKTLEIVDPYMKEYPEKEVIKYIKVAFFLHTISSKQNWPLMTQVVDMLSEEIQLHDKQIAAPGFSMDSRESSLKKSPSDCIISQFSNTSVSITQANAR